MARITLSLGSFIVFSLSCIIVLSNGLSVDYYAKTCPNVEHAVRHAVRKGMSNDATVPAALLRMHFHDCFIKGCDGSVLLNSTSKNKAEKDGPPNISLHAFYVIDHAKEAVEKMCPGVVSCADILALAARDSVHLSGGPTWNVPKGRLDGRVSNANDTITLPFPVFNITQLKQSFAQRGLATEDLVALSGGHTLGFAHCSSFQNRIHKFNKKLDVDPSLSPSFSTSLRKVCPIHNKVRSAGATLDATTTKFDNIYYKMIMQGKSIFSSDAALMTDPETKMLVHEFAYSNDKFNEAFAKSMVKMGSIPGGEEVRLHCRMVN